MVTNQCTRTGSIKSTQHHLLCYLLMYLLPNVLITIQCLKDKANFFFLTFIVAQWLNACAVLDHEVSGAYFNMK